MSVLEKILIIRFSSLGDVILASPLIRTLRTAFPSAQIDFLVKDKYSDVVRFNPYLSSVITLKTSDREELKSLKRHIRGVGYDLVIDIHNSLRSRWIRWGSGAVNIKVIKKKIVKRFFLVSFRWNFYGGIIPVADRYGETVSKYGVLDDGEGLDIFIPEEVQLTVGSVMERIKPEQYELIIGMGPTARHATKRWPPERFVELGVLLSKRVNSRIFIFGGKEDTDFCADIAQLINAHAGFGFAESFAGKLNLLETAAALDYCTVVVSNDSALMHIAAARRRKMIAIFGSSVKEFGFAPYRTPHIVIERNDVKCRPCSHIGLETCPKKHFRCMKDISATDVMAAVEELLRK